MERTEVRVGRPFDRDAFAQRVEFHESADVTFGAPGFDLARQAETTRAGLLERLPK